MVICSTSSYSVRVRTVTRPIAPAPPSTIICIKLAPLLLCYGGIAVSGLGYNTCLTTDDRKAGSRDGGMEFQEGILQAVQNGINLFAGDDQGWLNTNNA